MKKGGDVVGVLYKNNKIITIIIINYHLYHYYRYHPPPCTALGPSRSRRAGPSIGAGPPPPPAPPPPYWGVCVGNAMRGYWGVCLFEDEEGMQCMVIGVFVGMKKECNAW